MSGDDGSLTVVAHRGHGIAVLPAEYAHDHVRLGYAATEHGVQGDTTTIGIELVSAATTRRGAYVGLTRGREDNTVLVITESHDLEEAHDILDRIISMDRADVPATTQRRTCAETDRGPNRARPPEPRLNIPRWVHELRDDLRADLAHVDHQSAAYSRPL